MAQYVSLALFVLVGLVLAGFLALAPERFGAGSPWWLYPALGLAIAAVLGAVPRVLAHRLTGAFLMASVSAVVLYGIAGFITVPRLTELWLSPRLAEAVARHAQTGDGPVVTAGYAEPSIAFLLGTKTALDDGPGAGRTAASAGGLALVSDDQRGPFLGEVDRGGARAVALEEIAGLDYSRGAETRITLYRVVPHGK